MRNFLLFFFVVFLGESPLKAQYESPDVFKVGQNILINASENEYPYFLHRIKSKETLYSIAKAYGTPMQEILQYNTGLRPGGISVGETVKIPLSWNKFVTRHKDRTNKYVSVFFEVKKGQTLFNIAHRLFQIPIYDLTYNNDLRESSISPGDLLLIGWITLDAEEPLEEHDFTVTEPSLPYLSRTETAVTGLPIAVENGIEEESPEKLELVELKGAAYWNKTGKNRNGLFIMSSQIPVGTDVELFNPMSRRSVFARVIGNIPEGIYPDEILAIISPEAADRLRVIDQKFYVHLRYLVAAE